MPWFSLNRNYTLSTTKGHSVNFKKGERTWVPQGIVQEALGIGAIPEVPIDVLPEDEKKTVPGDLKRKEIVFAAFEKLLLRSNRGDFTASGHPHPKKLEEIVGFDTSERERHDLWEKYNAMKAEEANQ